MDLVELRRRVTSPGGTTERAIQSFEQDGLREMWQEPCAPPPIGPPKWRGKWAREQDNDGACMKFSST